LPLISRSFVAAADRIVWKNVFGLTDAMTPFLKARVL
jgi:hypothetical protein